MFREVVDRYRETFAPSPYDADDGEQIEYLAARVLSIRQVLCLQLRFILQASSRRAAFIMDQQGHPCSHTTYCTWVDDAIEKMASEA